MKPSASPLRRLHRCSVAIARLNLSFATVFDTGATGTTPAQSSDKLHTSFKKKAIAHGIERASG